MATPNEKKSVYKYTDHFDDERESTYIDWYYGLLTYEPTRPQAQGTVAMMKRREGASQSLRFSEENARSVEAAHGEVAATVGKRSKVLQNRKVEEEIVAMEEKGAVMESAVGR